MSELSYQEGMQLATETYSRGLPVIVFSVNEELLHGVEDLKAILALNAPLEAHIIRLDNTVEDWNESQWPEIFEAARRLWLQDKLPDT
jgi:hypothetical protein